MNRKNDISVKEQKQPTPLSEPQGRENSKKEDRPQTVACRLGKVGGEAVIEGVMMRAGNECCTTVRMEDGSMRLYRTHHVPLRRRYRICNLPILRGVINFIESLVLSYRIMGISAEAFGAEAMEESRTEKWLREKFGRGLMDVAMVIGIVLGLALAFGLFFYLPVLAGTAVAGTEHGALKSLIESVIKIGIFVLYIFLVSLMPDIRRVFQYHGAEHKSIFCYEYGEELTVENVKKQRRFHPRCGTSFIFVILILSFFFALLIPASLPTAWRVLTKLLILPLVVGVGFEFIMYAGKHENLFTKILSAPGLWMQRITTREPDDEMIQVAITSLKAALQDEFSDLALTPMPEKTGAKPSWFVGDASRLAEYLRAREIQAQAENTSQASAQEEPSDAVPSAPQQTDGETTLSNAAVEQKVKLDAACQPFRNDSDHTQNQTETPRSGGFAS